MSTARFRGIDIESSGAKIVVTGGELDAQMIKDQVTELKLRSAQLSERIAEIQTAADSAIAGFQTDKDRADAEIAELRALLTDAGVKLTR